MAGQSLKNQNQLKIFTEYKIYTNVFLSLKKNPVVMKQNLQKNLASMSTR